MTIAVQISEVHNLTRQRIHALASNGRYMNVKYINASRRRRVAHSVP